MAQGAARRIRIAVIGLGQWGPNHVRNFQNIDGCDVVAACDMSRERLAWAARHFRGVAATGDANALVVSDEVDAIVVATPVASHFNLVRRALEAGKDVLCEKPLAASSLECEKLISLARRRGRILMVGHVFVYNAGVLELKREIDRGGLGKLRYIDAIRTNLGPVRKDVGALLDLASHDVSIFNFLLGSMPTSVSATGRAFLSQKNEDIGFLTLTYPNNVLCHAHVSWLNPRKVRQLTVVGERRMAVWDDLNNLEPVRYYDKSVAAKHYASFGEFQMILRDGAITIPKIRMHEPLLRQDQEFVDSVRTRRTPLASARFGADVVRVLVAARRSLAANGRAVAIGARK